MIIYKSEKKDEGVLQSRFDFDWGCHSLDKKYLSKYKKK